MATQGTDKLVIVNGMPAVDKLQNGRFRLEFFCDPSNKTEGWYKENIDEWLPEFGSLQDHAISNGWEYPSNSDVAYDDMRLIEASAPFIPSADTHYVKLVYETLTDSFAQEKDDDIKQGQNNLRVASRSVIAQAETPYTNVVGVTTIQNTVDGLGEVELYLASADIEDTDAYRRVKEVWAEAGKISESDPLTGSDRLRVKTVKWQMVQGADPSGYVASAVDIDNIGGFKTITVSYYLGDDLSDSYTYNTTVPFTMPGTVDWSRISVGIGNNYMIVVTPPIRTICKATITEQYTTNGNTSTSGLYQPSGGVSVTISGVGDFQRPFSTSSSYSNHVKKSSGITLSGNDYVQGNNIFAGSSGKIIISGEEEDPAGAFITSNIDTSPAFRLADGTQYYKVVKTKIQVPNRTI